MGHCPDTGWVLRLDLLDADVGFVLAMAVVALMSLHLNVGKALDLLAPALLDDGAGHFGILHQRGADLRGIAADEQNLVQRDGRADFALGLFNDNGLVFGDAVLFTARANHCVHGLTSALVS